MFGASPKTPLGFPGTPSNLQGPPNEAQEPPWDPQLRPGTPPATPSNPPRTRPGTHGISCPRSSWMSCSSAPWLSDPPGDSQRQTRDPQGITQSQRTTKGPTPRLGPAECAEQINRYVYIHIHVHLGVLTCLHSRIVVHGHLLGAFIGRSINLIKGIYDIYIYIYVSYTYIYT